MIKKCIFLFIFHLIIVVGYGQKMSSSEIQNMAETNLSEGVDNLISFLKLPNDGHFEEQVTQNLNWVETIFKDLDFNTQIITTKGAPLLFAEKKYSRNKKTILFYLQIDGQPVDQKEWDQENAFIPVIKKQDEKEEDLAELAEMLRL